VEAFGAFLKKYMARFRFTSITTQDLLDFARAELPGALEQAGAAAWVDGEGVPANAPVPKSSRLEAVQKLGQGVVPRALASGWGPTEWQVYLNGLKPPLEPATLKALDEEYHLTRSANPEVLVAWLNVAVRSGYAPAVEQAEVVLGRFGRSKYLRPLYAALASRPETKERAWACLKRYRAGYHSIAVTRLEALLG
jgi:hypothetical protein